MDGSKITCKVCYYNGYYILKHLAKSTNCQKSYKEEEKKALQKLSKFDPDYKGKNEYDAAKRAKRYQKNKEKIALKYDPIKRAENHKRAKQNAINERKKQYENQVHPKKSIEELKENAIEKHLAFKEKTRKRFKDINDNLSKIKEVKDIKVDSIYTANTLDEEIENVALRAKLIDFDLKSVSDMFEELMRSIENQWVDINERISTIFEDLPIMRYGSKASEPE